MENLEYLSKMLALCVNHHEGQYDKGGTPYAFHPIAVMHMLGTDDEELKCIALGHDLIEDTRVDEELLWNQGFSKRVILGISALTKVKGQTYEEYKQAVFANRDAMIVKMADLRHNSDITRLKGVSNKDVDRMGRYMIFYNEIKERLKND